MSYRASAIKSVQTVTIAISGVTSNTATLGTAVDKNYSVVIITGLSTNSSAAGSGSINAISVRLTNGTTVTAIVNTADGATRTVYATVIEFFPHTMKQTVQHLAFLAATQSITAVGSKAVLFSGMMSTPDAGGDSTLMGGSELTSSTVVTRRGDAGASVSCCVADFK
jgi:hypothetical protein